MYQACKLCNPHQTEAKVTTSSFIFHYGDNPKVTILKLNIKLIICNCIKQLHVCKCKKMPVSINPSEAKNIPRQKE